MTTRSRPPPECPRLYSSSPRRAWRSTNSLISPAALSPDSNELKRKPWLRPCAVFAAPALNFPKPSCRPSARATIFPSASVSSVTRELRRAEIADGAIFCRIFFPGARKPAQASGVGKERRKFVFRHRITPQSQFYRHIVKPAGREAAIKVPQAGNDHPDHGNLDVGTRLVEHQEIEAGATGDLDAGLDLFAGVVKGDLQVAVGLDGLGAGGHQERIVLQTQWRGAIETRFLAGTASHQADREELVEFRQRPQHGDAAIEMRAGAELDIFPPVLYPVQYPDIGRDAEIAGDVEYPKLAAGFGELSLQ